jgi:hypothetical protein
VKTQDHVLKLDTGHAKLGNMIKLSDLITEAKENMEDFAETREAGAEKITDNAKKKGGLAMLTYHHFVVKLPYYKKAAEGKMDFEKAKKEYHELLEKLYKATKGELNIQQVEFQRLVGKIEVLGELLIKNK